jgi:hypothetical protein
MVFGGNYGTVGIGTASIEFYDLTLRPSSWESVAGVSLGASVDYIMGSVVKAFDIGHCDLMLQSSSRGFMLTCTGNYTWKVHRKELYPNGLYPDGRGNLALVDASMFGGKKIW